MNHWKASDDNEQFRDDGLPIWFWIGVGTMVIVFASAFSLFFDFNYV